MMFLVDLLPNSVRARIIKKKTDKLGLKMKSDKIPKQFGGWQQFKTIYNTTLQQSSVTLKVGDSVPAITLTNLETGKQSTLQSLMRSNVPLVLNFGSCTWPPFVGQLSRFGEVMEEYKNKVDFIIVYISEAHPSDGWVVSGENQELGWTKVNLLLVEEIIYQSKTKARCSPAKVTQREKRKRTCTGRYDRLSSWYLHWPTWR